MMKSSIVDYAQNNDIEKLKSVLDYSLEDINYFDYGRSALHAACISNAIGAAEYLLMKGINPNLPDSHTGAVPLHYCASYNHLKIARLIIEKNGRLDISDNFGNQPLWTAVFNVKGREDRLALLELFLANAADKNHKNKANKSPLDFANQVKFQPVLNLFEKY